MCWCLWWPLGTSNCQGGTAYYRQLPHWGRHGHYISGAACTSNNAGSWSIKAASPLIITQTDEWDALDALIGARLLSSLTKSILGVVLSITAIRSMQGTGKISPTWGFSHLPSTLNLSVVRPLHQLGPSVSSYCLSTRSATHSVLSSVATQLAPVMADLQLSGQ